MRLALLVLALLPYPARADSSGPDVRRYLRVDSPRVVLEHVNIIDGTGAAPVPDRNVYIQAGKIKVISAGKDESPSEGTTLLDLRGHSVTPGIVGMHNHLYCLARPNLTPDRNFDKPGLPLEMAFSAPRMYLASGVTTMRTAGSVAPAIDLKLKRNIDSGVMPGPHLDVTGPYLDGSSNPYLQMQNLTGPADATRTVAYWADQGVTSFKAYAHITREELSAAVNEAHRRGLKVTGHLCSVTYEEAAEIGIDNIEHGFLANTGQDPDKTPDQCSSSAGDYTLEHMTPGSPEADRLFATLLRHHVAITSTLVGLASSLPGQPPVRALALRSMAPSLRDSLLYDRNREPGGSNGAQRLRRDMDLQHAFVAAGGLLLAGADSVGFDGNIPGFGDQREIELLVEAGFAPVQAIRIATLNGAIYLGRQDQIGSIAVGKNADLVVVKGDPSIRIADIENVELVFKDGAGYDPGKLLDSVKGRYGEY